MANIIQNIIHLPWNQLELESSSKAIKRTAKAIKCLKKKNPALTLHVDNEKILKTLLSKLILGEEVQNKYSNESAKDVYIHYKNIAKSIIHIFNGLSTILLGCIEFKKQQNVVQYNVVAYLLKAFNQINHGVIWNGDDTIENHETQPTALFSTSNTQYGLEQSATSTGCSKDDIFDEKRLSCNLLKQLHNAIVKVGARGEYYEFVKSIEVVFPLLSSVFNLVDNFTDVVRNELKSLVCVTITHGRLNMVNGKMLNEYSVPKSLSKTLPTLPLSLTDQAKWKVVLSKQEEKRVHELVDSDDDDGTDIQVQKKRKGTDSDDDDGTGIQVQKKRKVSLSPVRKNVKTTETETRVPGGYIFNQRNILKMFPSLLWENTDATESFQLPCEIQSGDVDRTRDGRRLNDKNIEFFVGW